MSKEMASDNKACKNIKSKLKDTGERIIPGDPAFNYSFQHHLIAYEWALGFCDGKNVLDVGSGDGYGCSLLAEKAAKVVGIDSSAEAIQHARERYQAENLFFQKADAYSLPFENLCFDVVCSFQVIEHLKYPEKHLQEIKRVLTEDGVLLLSTPNRVQFGGEFHLKIPFHYREFTPPELETLLKKHFVQVEILGLWGGHRIESLHEMDRQSVLRLVKLDPLGIRRLVPRKFYELVYPFMWKKSRKQAYEKYKDLIDSITTKDFYLKPLSGSSEDLSCWDIYAVARKT